MKILKNNNSKNNLEKINNIYSRYQIINNLTKEEDTSKESDIKTNSDISTDIFEKYKHDFNKRKDTDTNSNNFTFNNYNSIFLKNPLSIKCEFDSLFHNLNISVLPLISAEKINNYCSNNTNGE